MSFKFEDVTLSGWILLGALLALAAVLFLIARRRQKWTPRMLANAAVCMALSFVLSYIRLFRMPQGGSVTPASLLPVCAFAFYYGPVPGLVTGLAYGFLQLLQDPWIVGAAQALLDYPLAFSCIAFMGLMRLLCEKLASPRRREIAGWASGVALTGAGRFLCHTLSGVAFFASYADGSGLSPLAYSLAYNSYIFVDLAVCLAVALFPQVRAAMRRMTE